MRRNCAISHQVQLFKSLINSWLAPLALLALPLAHLRHLRYTLFTGDCPVQPEQMQSLAQSPAAEAIMAEATAVLQRWCRNQRKKRYRDL